MKTEKDFAVRCILKNGNVTEKDAKECGINVETFKMCISKGNQYMVALGKTIIKCR